MSMDCFRALDSFKIDTRFEGFERDLNAANIRYIMHTTKLENILSILSSQKLLSRKSLIENGSEIENMGGDENFVYMQLVPEISIREQQLGGFDFNFYLSGNFRDPNAAPQNAILLFENKKSNEASFLTPGWEFGMFNENDSAFSHDKSKLKAALDRISLGVGNEMLFPDTNLSKLKKILVHPDQRDSILRSLEDIELPEGFNSWSELIIGATSFPSEL